MFAGTQFRLSGCLMKNVTRLLIPAFFLFFTFAVIIHVARHYTGLQLFPWLLTILRWIPLGCLFIYAITKNKLTTWIFVSMLFGVEFGYDVPEVAKELNIVSQIFIHLVKTIIAPLLFGTLVTGIAGHANAVKPTNLCRYR